MLCKAKWLPTLTFVVTYFAVGAVFAQVNPQFGLEIKSDVMEKPLRIQTSAVGKRRLYAYVPVNGSGGVSTIRVVPDFRDGKLAIELYEVTGDFTSAKSCADRLLLPSRLASTELMPLQLNKTLTVNADAGWTLQLTLIDGSSLTPSIDKFSNSFAGRADQPEGGCGCGSCSGLSCCPDSGQCLGCGECGLVCCNTVVVRPG